LVHLLRLHPDLGGPGLPIYEDFFLDRSDDLFRFAERARKKWDPGWGWPEDIDDHLLRCLGDALVSFLECEPGKRLVVKNPSVRNLDRFFSLFPSAQLIILVRDGRSVVQSGMASFGWDFASSVREWAEAADEIEKFTRSSGEQSRFLMVRYEDLVTDLRPQLERILDFCRLDRSSFDFAKAARMPVYGSSEFFGPERTSLHWRAVARDETFAPLHRWRAWPTAMHEDFWDIAGPQMHRLGYTDDAPPEPTSLRRRFRRRRSSRAG
jgi:hypothetical protein